MNEDNKITLNIHNEPIGLSACRNRNQKLRRRSRLLPLSPTTPSTSIPAPLQVDTDGSESQHHLNVSFKHEIDAKKIKTAKDNETQSNLSKVPATSLCNMCCRKDDVCVNLQHNHTTVLTVSDITRLPSWDIRQILASVCSRCLVYIGAITESSSRLRMRCEQAMHSQSVVLAPPTPDTSPNNFLQVTTTLLDDAPDQSNCLQQQRNCYAPSYCNDTAHDLTLPIASSSPPLAVDFPNNTSTSAPALLSNQSFEAISRSPTPSHAGQNSMLTIHYERSVSPLNTESGGGGKNNKRSYQRVQVIPVQMICNHCNRAYWRKDYYRKHMRRCSARNRYAKSLVSTRSHSVSRLELDAISVVSEGNEHISIHRMHRIFRCNICTVTVDNIRKLRQHKRMHLPRFYCDICNEEYTSRNEYDFHHVQCMAKKEVYEKGLEEFRNAITSTAPISNRRKTRSYSRAQSMAPSLAPSQTTSTKKGETSAKRTRTSNKKQAERTQNGDKHSTITTSHAKRNKHIYTNKTDDAQSANNYEKLAGHIDVDDDDEYEDDDVSQVDTFYSKRLSLTNHWVEEHSLSSQSHLSQSDNYIEDDYIYTICSLKEYDLHLLDRLKIGVRLNSLTCFVTDCKFTCATLNEMMVHDYFYHYKKPWFYCHKCGYCFTSKVFLDYHLDLQNKGRYVCYKCGGHFEYQHQLDRHLFQHYKLSSQGGEKYVCHFCNLKFLDEDKLLKHCHYENHDWYEKKHTIEIDHSMTISNKVPQNPSIDPNSKEYQVKILNMVLKLMPSKRCTPMEKYRSHLPPHLRLTNRIGQVEFRYPLNPNCVGCL